MKLKINEHISYNENIKINNEKLDFKILLNEKKTFNIF